MLEYIAFGESVAVEAVTVSPLASSVLAAIRASKAFEFVERRLLSTSEGAYDVIVVDCVDDQVPTRNAVGILPRERLALALPADTSKPPQVRALRANFPLVMHLNHVAAGEPVYLCLYFEPWPSVRRSWTPQKFFQRILWWLTESACGRLHGDDQPVEAMYFESPIDVVLPPNWEADLDGADNVLKLFLVQRDKGRRTLRALVAPRAAATEGVAVVALRVRVKPVVHAGIERFPATLGELSDALEGRGSSLLEPLCTELRRRSGTKDVGSSTLLILSIPTKRADDDAEPRVDVRGFELPVSFGKLGVATGVLFAPNEVLQSVTLLGEAPRDWRDINVVPVTVKNAVTRAFARAASSLNDDGAEDRRVLAGVGALGGCLADLWTRECWGSWTYADPDFIQPHNVVRHSARDADIGQPKAALVARQTMEVYPFSSSSKALNEDVLAASPVDLSSAALIVDATTTLEVPRELAQRDVARSVSVFVTPSGGASVLILEDARRTVRLDALEAQYYAAILRGDWGAHHLDGHHGDLWIGAGCRDLSVILSKEMVTLHASILAKQVRLLTSESSAQIHVWVSDDKTSSVTAIDLPVHDVINTRCDDWVIVSNLGLEAKLSRLREAQLPNETGGIVVGYIDSALKKIFIVDVLPGPVDSEQSESGFVRGVQGLAGVVESVKKRTAHVVDYIGEWHSHPRLNSPTPSRDDVQLLAHLAKALALDGVPAVMAIVGDHGEVSYSFRTETSG